MQTRYFAYSKGKSMAPNLSKVKVAIIIAHGFEQDEMTEPRKALEAAGATVHILSPEKDSVRGWKNNAWADEFEVTVAMDKAQAQDYDALVLPGGVMNPDKLRIIPKVIQFVNEFATAGKPIASICHGPWTLINAEAVKDRTMTSWPSLQKDLENAGATWIDKEVVRDGNFVTSRKPEDLPAFNSVMLELFAE